MRNHILTPSIGTLILLMVMSHYKPSMERTLRDCGISSESMTRKDGSISGFHLREGWALKKGRKHIRSAFVNILSLPTSAPLVT